MLLQVSRKTRIPSTAGQHAQRAEKSRLEFDVRNNRETVPLSRPLSCRSPYPCPCLRLSNLTQTFGIYEPPPAPKPTPTIASPLASPESKIATSSPLGKLWGSDAPLSGSGPSLGEKSSGTSSGVANGADIHAKPLEAGTGAIGSDSEPQPSVPAASTPLAGDKEATDTDINGGLSAPGQSVMSSAADATSAEENERDT